MVLFRGVLAASLFVLMLGAFSAIAAPPGFVDIDDMILPIEATGDRGVYKPSFWPNHVVPFEFDPAVSPTNQGLARAAMGEIEAVANIRFINRTTEADYLVVRPGTMNRSFIGFFGGMQEVEIVSWTRRFAIVHELMHTLGAVHEHQRIDRDAFIQINLANIQSGRAVAFQVLPLAPILGPYDFESVMHYRACTFSVCCSQASPCTTCLAACQTITVQPGYEQWQSVIGVFNSLSTGDIAWLQFAYAIIDCNANGIHDGIDIRDGTSLDANANGIPDECELCYDANGDQVVNFADITSVVANWLNDYTAAPAATGPGDSNGDGTVNFTDISDVVANWLTVCP